MDTELRNANGVPEPAPDGGLVARAVLGDQAAITLLLTRSHARLHAHLSGRIPASMRAQIDADDLLQETCIAVFQNAARFEPRGPDSWYRWVATIAIRKLRNAVQACRARKRGGDRVRMADDGAAREDSVICLLELMEGPENTPSRHAATKESRQALTEAIALLPESLQEAVRLVYLEGYSVGEAATQMKRTDRAVHNLCFKAKRELRDLLGTESRFFGRSG